MRRFATGVLKDRLLTHSGPYRVIKWRSETVALFKNGTMARFYDDGVPEDAPQESPPAHFECGNKTFEQVEVAAAIAQVMTEPKMDAEKSESSLISPPSPAQVENFWKKIKRWMKEPV